MYCSARAPIVVPSSCATWMMRSSMSVKFWTWRTVWPLVLEVAAQHVEEEVGERMADVAGAV